MTRLIALPPERIHVLFAADTAIDPELVTPGVVGFVATIFVALATILLVWDMVRRIRRQRYQAEIDAKLDAEEAALAKARKAKD